MIHATVMLRSKNGMDAHSTEWALQSGVGYILCEPLVEILKDIPIIVISGLAGRHLAVTKPVAVFDKPVDRNALLKVVRETIG